MEMIRIEREVAFGVSRFNVGGCTLLYLQSRES